MIEPLRAWELAGERPRDEEESRSLRVLVVLDEVEASRAVRAALADEDGGVDVEWLHSVDEGLATLRHHPFDVVLLDAALVGNGALALVDDPAFQDSDAWLVLLAEPPAKGAYPRRLLAAAAHETLLRDERLADALAGLLRFARRSVAVRARASRYQSLFRHSADGILLFDGDGVVLDVNPRGCEQLGYERDELCGLRVDALHAPEERVRVRAALGSLAREGTTVLELALRRRDGSTFPAEVSASAFSAGGHQLVQAVVRDLSPRRALEQRLQEVQKMEALGRLAGGVAHDLNNLLTVIRGYGSLLAAVVPGEGEAHAFLDEVAAAGERAAALTQQLLAFSRRQVVRPQLVDVNAELGRLQRLLRGTLGEDVRLLVDLAPDLPSVWIDPAQLQQVIVNLAVNARDAMPQGGELTLKTGLARPPGSIASNGDGDQPWVRLQVRDSGVGMSAEVLGHLFEPFFTTKERGKGTGLGLASVYGAVRQSGGDVRVTSAPGAGTTIEVLLPPARGEAAATSDSGAHPVLVASPRGGRSVLVVEDDEAVRRLVVTVLRGAGYEVVAAEDGDAALAIAGARERPLDLVLCDVVLPDRSGVEVARRITALCPSARTLLMSGHAQDAIARSAGHGRPLRGSRFIAKPFGPEALLENVAKTLAR
jgi:PAS domain S-box-containing protein